VSEPSAASPVKQRLRRPQGLADVEVKTTVPRSLADRFERLVALECSTAAATARRLIAIGVQAELSRHGAPAVARG
jgi:hypothetical protein